jgi:hypothetical protein
MKKIVFAVACLAWSVFTGSGQGTTTFEGVTSFTRGNYTGYGDTLGWSFQPRASIKVTDLGCLAIVFEAYSSVNIGLWSGDGTMLDWREVSATNTPAGQSYYSSITPIFLNQGETYWIGAFSPSGSISLSAVGNPPDLDGQVTVSDLIQLSGYATGTNGFSIPNGGPGPAGSIYLGANFQYQNIPEPSTVALLCLAALANVAWSGARKKA